MELNQQNGGPKYNPVLMSLSNVIIFGAGYLVLRKYTRFFIVYGIMFTLVTIVTLINFQVLGMLSAEVIMFLSYGLAIFVIIDTYIQSKRFNEGKLLMPEKNKGLLILGVITIIIFVIGYIGTQIYIQVRTMDQSYFGIDDSSREINKKQEEVESKYTPLQDAHCNSLREDESLDHSLYLGNMRFTEYCYFKKAVETNDPLYCNSFYEQLGFKTDCLAYLAIKNQKPEICSEMSQYENVCMNSYNTGINVGLNPVEYPCSSSSIPETLKPRCLSEFAEFEKTLELK